MPTTRKRPRTSELERTAYHEAGHAVMAFILRRAVKSLSIIPTEDSLGHVQSARLPDTFHPDYNTDKKTRDWCEREVLIRFAGGIAEAKFSGRKNHAGASTDYRHAVNMADFMCGTTKVLETYLAYLFACAEAHFKQPGNWWAVEAIAQELLAHKEVSGRRAREIFADQTRNRPFRDREEYNALCRAALAEEDRAGLNDPSAA